MGKQGKQQEESGSHKNTGNVFSIERLDRPMVVTPTPSNGLSAPALCARGCGSASGLRR